MIGQTISHYKILEKLGEGGMGIVYKAQDTKLDRTIALKFLPAHVSLNEETKARFLQEAKAAAALNHPNICTIHGVEEDGGNMFIVMEFVDGGTLRQKIPFSSIDDVIKVAMQIGEALQEAHAKEIVHRDIKADNIMLTSKGQAKVMDFGLAKLKGSLKLTRTSSTVGTLAYMAPEQIQGGEVDSRSDIFSFGSLLFEMLTGKTPFRGEHEAAMLYSIVNEEPMSLESLRPDVSPLLSNLISRCLEKDPADRYQHMDDLVSELRRTQKKSSGKVMRSSSYIPAQPPSTGTASGVVSHVEPVASTVPVKGTSPIARYGLIGAAALVILGVAGWFLFSKPGLSVNPSMTTRVLQVPFTQYSYPSLSPDGKWVAFPAADASGKWDIYYMHVNGGEPRKITSDATTFIQQGADISPDGSQIVYDRTNDNNSSHDVFAISSLGGTSRKLATGATAARWRPDGERVGFIRTRSSRTQSESGLIEFLTVKADGSDLRREYADSLFVTAGSYRFNFCWSPDGKSIAWIRSLNASSQVLILRELNTGKERQLTQGNENLDAMVWTADDRIIFSSNRGGNTNLWAIPAKGGEAVQVTKGGGPDIGLSVSASGNELVYLQQQRVGYLWTGGIDGSALRQISFDDRQIWDPSFSPDKKRIAFIMNDPDPLKTSSDLYVLDSDGNNRRRLTNGVSRANIPSWSPDGRMIMYAVGPTGQGSDTTSPKVFVVDADNPGAPKLIGKNWGLGWLDDDHILSVDDRRSFIVTVSSGTTRKFFVDSVTVFLFSGGKRLVYYDWHSSKEGWWTIDIEPTTAAELAKQTGEVIMPVVRGSARKVSSSANPLTAWPTSNPLGEIIVQFAGEDKVRLISSSGRKEELLTARFPGLRNSPIGLSHDGQQLVFVVPRLSSRLILLEKVFQ